MGGIYEEGCRLWKSESSSQPGLIRGPPLIHPGIASEGGKGVRRRAALHRNLIPGPRETAGLEHRAVFPTHSRCFHFPGEGQKATPPGRKSQRPRFCHSFLPPGEERGLGARGGASGFLTRPQGLQIVHT